VSTKTANSPVGAARLSGLILLPGRAELAARVRDALVAHGGRAVVIDDPLIPESAGAAAVRALDLAGVIAVSTRALSPATLTELNPSQVLHARRMERTKRQF